jgi:hypothetical protein
MTRHNLVRAMTAHLLNQLPRIARAYECLPYYKKERNDKQDIKIKVDRKVVISLLPTVLEQQA